MTDGQHQMQVAILCGGLGTRLREETEHKPKPMVEIGHRPILWHIMRYYGSYNYNRFVLCTGYKQNVIKQYFLNYQNHSHDIEVNLSDNSIEVLEQKEEELPWSIRIQDTGVYTLTASRLKQAMRYIDGDIFLATYGDGVSDIDLNALVAHHKKSGKLATLTAVRPSSRFGELGIDGDLVTAFHEKPNTGSHWVNGGFFVFSKEIFEALPVDDDITLEEGVLHQLSNRGELSVYRHEGFWQCMDTRREMYLLEDLWRSGNAPWKNW